jgi:hypothetical protein
MIASQKVLFASAAAALFLAIAQQPASAQQVLYGSTGAGLASGGVDSPSSLYTINPATGESTLVGPIGFSGVNSIDFNPDTGVLYGIANVSRGENSVLITINTQTGLGTLVAPLSPDFQSPDMSFNSSGTLYTWSEPSTDHLNTVNLTTGETTDVGVSGLLFGTARLGLDVDSFDVIYIKNSDGSIYTVDPSTGMATLASGIGTSISFDNVLAFDASDTLYTVDRDSGNSFLYTIDLTAGTAALIGSTGLATLSALAFSPTVIPEPETYAMLLAGLGLLGFAMRTRRTRSVQ